MGVYVTRLSAVMQAQLSQFEQDKQELDNAAERLEDAARDFDKLKDIESMFGGDTDISIRDSASKLTRVIEETQLDLLRMKDSTETGRQGIQAAQAAYQSLPSGQPNGFEQGLGLAIKVLVPGVGIMAGSAFLEFITAAREAERERQARAALRKLGQDMHTTEGQLPDVVAPKDKHQNGDDANNPDTTPKFPGHGTGIPSDRNTGTGTNGVDANGTLTPAERVRQAIERGLNSVSYDENAGVGDYPGVVPAKNPLPSIDKWPFDVYHPGDINRDGPLQGGYRVNADPSLGQMPRDPMLRSTIEEGQAALGGNLGALGAAGAVGAGALALGGAARAGSSVPMGAIGAGAPGAAAGAVRGGMGMGMGMGMMGGMAGGAPGAAGGNDKKSARSGRLGGPAAGRPGVGGGAGRAGAVGGAARGGMGMMGGMAGGAPGTAGANEKSKKSGKGRLGAASAGRASAARGGTASAPRAGMTGGAAAAARSGVAGAGAVGARGGMGMLGGMAGGAPASGSADNKAKKNTKGRFGLGAGTGRGAAAAGAARGASGGSVAAGAAGAAAGRGGAGAAGAARGGMMGGLMGGLGSGKDEKQAKKRTNYGASGVEFFDLAGEKQLGEAGRSGRVSKDVIEVATQDDSRW